MNNTLFAQQQRERQQFASGQTGTGKPIGLSAKAASRIRQQERRAKGAGRLADLIANNPIGKRIKSNPQRLASQQQRLYTLGQIQQAQESLRSNRQGGPLFQAAMLPERQRNPSTPITDLPDRTPGAIPSRMLSYVANRGKTEPVASGTFTRAVTSDGRVTAVGSPLRGHEADTDPGLATHATPSRRPGEWSPVVMGRSHAPLGAGRDDASEMLASINGDDDNGGAPKLAADLDAGDANKFSDYQQRLANRRSVGRQRQFARAQMREALAGRGPIFTDGNKVDMPSTLAARFAQSRPDLAAQIMSDQASSQLQQAVFGEKVQQQAADRKLQEDQLQLDRDRLETANDLARGQAITETADALIASGMPAEMALQTATRMAAVSNPAGQGAGEQQRSPVGDALGVDLPKPQGLAAQAARHEFESRPIVGLLQDMGLDTTEATTDDIGQLLLDRVIAGAPLQVADLQEIKKYIEGEDSLRPEFYKRYDPNLLQKFFEGEEIPPGAAIDLLMDSEAGMFSGALQKERAARRKKASDRRRRLDADGLYGAANMYDSTAR